MALKSLPYKHLSKKQQLSYLRILGQGCSQFEEKDWYNQICDGESTLADAIMDRISFDSYKINIEYIDKSIDKSMREVYGQNPSEAQ